ncbi:uncharacterized protein LOC143887752 [Tasmannia lanceolata]|uniref:uncharacterized protein LOC143887752 n=1 Tax=Tasmannia lanceolata TaxID=3420 RepID=UPI004064654A
MAQLFPISLVGIAKKWFLRLKLDEVRTMEDISDQLIKQFSMEEGIGVTKRDLKQLKQGPQETFTTFIRCWSRKSAQLNQRNMLSSKVCHSKKIDNKDLEVERPNMLPPPVTNAIFVNEPLLDPSTLICAITSDKPYVLRLDDEEIEELTKEKPYVLSLTDDVEEEQMNKVPYVLKIEDDDLLFLDDQCYELQHVTRGSRVFKPPELSAENLAEIARAAGNQRQNRPVTEEEDESLLKQLKKTQANISIWGLLMSSPKHRKVILRELNAAQVSVDVTPDELDLPPEGRDHTKSLKVTVICNKKKVPEVLVDNEFALNVCPLSTATTLGFGPENFVPSEQGILAYDGTHRDVIGTLITEIQIGGEEFEIEFQVLDIEAFFLLLLGRPWLNRVGVIPSTLHQKLKFIRNNRVVTVKGDPNLEIG